MSGQEPRCSLTVTLSDGEVECPDNGGFRVGVSVSSGCYIIQILSLDCPFNFPEVRVVLLCLPLQGVGEVECPDGGG